MRSKVSRVLAAALFLPLSGFIACEQSAEATSKSEDVKPLTSQTIQADTQAQPAPVAEKPSPVRPVAGKRTSAVRAQPAKPTAATEEFKPVVGQPGKDVIWVPTPEPLVDRMLDMANLTRNDVHFDLGSGDGRTVIAAAKRGAKSTGVEYNPKMVALSRRLALKEGVGEKATFVEGDIFKTDFSNATVLTLFLLADLNLKLRPTILEMKPGTRVVSNIFTMGEWEPDQTERVTDEEGCASYCTAYLWIVPAKVGGRWRLPDGDLVLTQTFQRVTGTLGTNQVEGALRGDQLTLVAGNARYAGRVNGNTMTGRVTNGSSTKAFAATRVGS